MRTIMLVDDEALSRQAIRIMLEQSIPDIHVVCEAQTGLEAVELYRQYRPDGVIMDITLPTINGLEASKQILQEFPTACIIICTAYDSFSFVSQALDIGVKSYLLKPVNGNEAVDKIKQLLLNNPSKDSHYTEYVEFEGKRNRKLSELYENLQYHFRRGAHSKFVHDLDAFIKEVFCGDYEYALSCCFQLLSLLCYQSELLGIANDPRCILQLIDVDPQTKDAPYQERALCLEKTLRRTADYMLYQVEQSSNQSKSALKNFRDYINDENLGTLSLETLAKQIGISPQYLSRIFKEEAGENFIDYITKERIDLACRLLLSTNMPIKKISVRCGYCDINYFNRVFKKALGMTPAEFKAGVASN